MASSTPKQDMSMPVLPPLLHTRSTNDVNEHSGTPNRDYEAFISPMQTPQGSPSKNKLPPGAFDLPDVFSSALKLFPTQGQPNTKANELLHVVACGTSKAGMSTITGPGAIQTTLEQTEIDPYVSWDPLNYSVCVECALSDLNAPLARMTCCPHRPWMQYGLEQFQAALRAAELETASIYSIRSPATNRVQLQQSFVDLFFPPLPKRGFATLDFIQQCMSRDHVAIHSAVETLFLLQIGISSKDDSLLQEAQQSYKRSIQYIRGELATATIHHSHDDLLGALHVICLSNQYNVISHESADYQQLKGVFPDLIRARGAASVTDEFQLMQMQDYWLFALTFGLIQRKPLVPTDAAWRRLARKTAGDFKELTVHLLRLPALLEATDFLLVAEHKSTAAIKGTIAELTTLGEKTRMAVERQTARASSSPPYRTVSAGPRHN